MTKKESKQMNVGDYWRNRKVLVTGAGGFIGSHLSEVLAEKGAMVRALVRYSSSQDMGCLKYIPVHLRNRVELVKVDLPEAEILRTVTEGTSVIFHLAAIVDTGYELLTPSMIIKNDTCGLLNLLSAAIDSKIERFVYVSSWEVYGNPLQFPTRENSPLVALSVDAASKIAGEKIVESYANRYAIDAVIVRPFSVYGPRQNPKAIIPTIIRQIVASEEVRLGKRDNERDFIYVQDVVEGLMRLGSTKNAMGKAVNLGTGKSFRVDDVVKMVCSLAGKEHAAVQFDPTRLRISAGDVAKAQACIDLLKELTGWGAETPLDKGLDMTIRWYATTGYAKEQGLCQ